MEPVKFVAKPQAIGIRDSATYLGTCEKTVRRLIADGQLPAVKVRKAYRIRIADLDKLLGVPQAS